MSARESSGDRPFITRYWVCKECAHCWVVTLPDDEMPECCENCVVTASYEWRRLHASYIWGWVEIDPPPAPEPRSLRDLLDEVTANLGDTFAE